MKILLHCIYYAPEVGGLESHVGGLARGLVARGHEVRLVTSRSIPGSPRDEDLRGVRVRRTFMPSRNPIGWAVHSMGSIAQTRAWAGWADLLHAQAFASVPPVGLAAGSSGKPWLASFHTSHFLLRARRKVWRPILARLVRWPDHALAASREIAEVAMELGQERPVEALTNGVDTTHFRCVPPSMRFDPETRVVVVPRRLFRKNGVEHLVRAVPHIRERMPGIRVLLVGDGPEGSNLRALARELGVAHEIRFLGSRPHDEMPALLASAEVAVIPSLMEATSVAALEAMACERPVVATSVGGLPEIVDEGVGRIVPPADPRALADAVVELLGSGDLAAMGRRARERVISCWSNERLVNRHLEIYEDLIARRPVRAPVTERTPGSESV